MPAKSTNRASGSRLARFAPPGKHGGVELIDAHVHLYPPEVNADPAGWAAARREVLWAALCTRRRRDGSAVQGFPAITQLLADMDAAGVRRAVLQGWYWENHATCVEHNAYYAACVKAHPERLSAFATVHPAAGGAALDEVRRAKDAGFAGLGELSPHSQQVPLDDPIWRQVLELAGDLKLPVNLHVTDPASRPYPARVDTPLSDFIALARDFPETNFILAHWGGGLAWSKEAAGLRNVWFDTAASPLLYGPEVWKKGPSDRVLFGSDYPLVVYPQVGAVPRFEGIVAEALAADADQAIFHRNAATLLGLG
ncbi:MAG TPA: TatD family hydrolase, partial [Lacunisphaera sp.]|nr:TatD family hydrolase [Lacunisphaera sp.]